MVFAISFDIRSCESYVVELSLSLLATDLFHYHRYTERNEFRDQLTEWRFVPPFVHRRVDVLVK